MVLMPAKYHKDAFRLLSLMDDVGCGEPLDFYDLIKMDEEDIARLMYLLGMGYMAVESTTEEYVLTDKGEQFLMDYDPVTDTLTGASDD